MGKRTYAEKMNRYVLDTNVLLISFPKKSPFRSIFDALINGDFTLLISEEILQEYLEIISEKTTKEIAENVGELLLQLPNVERTDIHFKWNLIEADADDNKFVDCAISGNAKFIVTNDSHFKILKTIEFPKVYIISARDFLDEI